MTDTNKETLRKIHNAYENKNSNIISKIDFVMGVPIELSEKLLEKFNELGDTPLLEPELATALENKGAFGFATALTKRLEIKSGDFPTMEFASFINFAREKISSFTHEDGTYKSTPLTEKAEFPKFDDLEYLSESSVKIRDLAQAVSGGDDTKSEEFLALQDEQMEFIYKLTGVDGDKLSEWEKALLKENIIVFSAHAVNSAMGRSL